MSSFLERTTSNLTMCDSTSIERSFELPLAHNSFSSFNSMTSDEDQPPRIPKRSSISFNAAVHVREYNVTIGDDRQCAYPMTLTWESRREHYVDIQDNNDPSRRTSKPRRLSSQERRDLLHAFGHSHGELNQNLRKRKTRLSLEYAYGNEESQEASRSFEDQQFRYII